MSHKFHTSTSLHSPKLYVRGGVSVAVADDDGDVSGEVNASERWREYCRLQNEQALRAGGIA